MSSFSRTISSSNEKLNNESKSSNPLDKKLTNYQTNSPNSSSSKQTSNQQNSLLKMSISPSLSSNQSSAASSVNSLIDNQEELTNLTNYVKNFREQLGKLRRIISNEINKRKDDDEYNQFLKDSKESSIKDLTNKELLNKDESSSNFNKELTRELSKESTKDELIDKQELFKAQVHDKLADVLRVLKIIFEKYSQIQSSDLCICSKNLIENVKGFPYYDQTANLNELLDKIDQLAVSFSNRVSEYLMEGDCLAQPKAKSSASFDYSTNQSTNKYVCDSNNNNLNQQPLTSNLAAIANTSDNSDFLWNSVYNMFVPFHKRYERVFSADATKKEDSSQWDLTSAQAQLSSDECDEIINKMNQAVEFSLQNAKLWSKYTKDITMYIEKRINIQMENSKNFLKLAQTMKPILKESDNLPLQILYLNMIDLDIKNHKAYFANCSLILGHKFLEPLNALRNENEKCRKACKNQWNREYKKLLDSVNNLKKTRSIYIAKRIELERCKQALKNVLETGASSSYNLNSSNLTTNNQSINQSNQTCYIQSTNFSGQQLNHIQMETSSEQIKLDKKRKLEDEATIKAYEAENTYRNAVIDANERARTCENIKKTILNRIKDLDYKSDLTLTSVTSNYLQIQKLVTSAEPVDFQQLLKEVENYPLGSSDCLIKLRDSNQKILNCFNFIPYETNVELNQGSMSFERSDYEQQNESIDLDNLNQTGNLLSSNTRMSSQGNLTSEELETIGQQASTSKRDSLIEQQHQLQQQLQLNKKNKKAHRRTKVAMTHHFRTVRTLSKCKECDNLNFNFSGLECSQCGICVHKKCIETLTIKCGLKPLNKRINIFQLDLCNQSTNNEVPFIVKKCIQEINRRGLGINGLYRVSGVKSQVEKLCSDFEIGGDLVELSSISPTVLTSVLKFYFRSLPEPLLTYRLYSDFIQVGKHYPNIKQDLNSGTDELNITNNQALLKELRHTCNKLPEVHLNTLDYLMKHLKKVSENSSINMPANNLGIVFGPTLLRANEGSTTLSTSLVDTVHQNRVIELLIIYYNELFAGNLVQDDNDQIEQEFDNIIDSLKNIGIDDREIDEEDDEEDDNNDEEQLDNLIQDLNKTELLTKDSSRQINKHHLSKDSEDFQPYLKGQNSVDRPNEFKMFTAKFNAPRPSLHELRKQFFTSETTSTSPFHSFRTSEEQIDKRSLNIEREKEKRSQDNQQSSTSASSSKSINKLSSTSKQSLNQQLSQSKSPKSSTLQLFKSKDDREPKYV